MRGNFVESLQAYGEAKRLHPGYSAIYEGMGRVYGQMGELEKAVDSFDEAIRLEKGNAPDYSLELAQLYLAEGYARKAVETLLRAKEKSPDRIDLWLVLGTAFLADERYAAAAREFRDVLEMVPDSEVAKTQLVKALRAEGRNREADQVYLDLSAPDLPKH
jgi:tetratricopeptide (TPR) repeat protein